MGAKKYKPFPVVPFKIHNISDFVSTPHPILIPEDPEYEIYWMKQLEYIISGKWGHDFKDGEGGYRWIPPALYFYINMCSIIDEGENADEIEISPRLRDIDWLIGYWLVTCDGFSGFKDDDQYTCHRVVGKIQNGETLLKREEMLFKKESFKKTVYKKDGTLKEYVEAREYLYRTFDKQLGEPYMMNEKKDFMLLSSRGIGKSFGIINMCGTHKFVTNGAQTVSDYLNKKTSATIVVGSELNDKSSELLSKFELSYENIRKNVGAYKSGDYVVNGAFWSAYEGTLSPGAKRPFTNKVTLKGGKGKTGPGSKIIHVSFHNNPQAAVGYRAAVIIVEEVGILEAFGRVHAENDATLKRRTKFGFSAYIGTGGNIKKIREVREAFYNPDSFGLLSTPDLFNETSNRIALFIPSYYRNDLYRDENGNMDYEAAFSDEMSHLESLKKSGSSAYEDYLISFPIYPQHMFLSPDGNIFPSDIIDNRLYELESGDFSASFGMLKYTNSDKSEVKWVEDLQGDLPIIKRYGDERNLKSLETGITIFEHPKSYRPEMGSKNPMYIVLYDLIFKDDTGTSMTSAVVFKIYDFVDSSAIKFNIVAEFIGRYKRVEDNHEIALKLASYYGCRVLSEHNGDFIRYARMTGRYSMLEDRPSLALDGEIKQKVRNEKGIYIQAGMIGPMERYLLDVLTTVVDSSEKIDGNRYEIEEKIMLEECPSMLFLDNLLSYSRQGNFDYISSMFLLGVYIRQMNLNSLGIDINEIDRRELESRFIKSIKKGGILLRDTSNVGFNY